MAMAVTMAMVTSVYERLNYLYELVLVFFFLFLNININQVCKLRKMILFINNNKQQQLQLSRVINPNCK